MTLHNVVVNFRSFHITILGAILLVTLVVAIATFALGPASVQGPALLVAVVLAFLLIGGLSGGRGGRSTKSLSDRRAEFGGRSRFSSEEVADPEIQAEAWRHERERRKRTSS